VINAKREAEVSTVIDSQKCGLPGRRGLRRRPVALILAACIAALVVPGAAEPKRQADLAIAKTDGVTTLVASDGATHSDTITVANRGPGHVTDVMVSDEWPAGFTLGQVRPSQGGSCTGEPSFTCTRGKIRSGRFSDRHGRLRRAGVEGRASDQLRERRQRKDKRSESGQQHGDGHDCHRAPDDLRSRLLAGC
jgi:uncharacterized repeat protein (TIGR01451 family)